MPFCAASVRDNILLAYDALLDEFPQDASRAGLGAGLRNLVPGEQSNLPEYFDDIFFVVRHDASEGFLDDYGRGSEGQWELSDLGNAAAKCAPSG